jgi:solute carrier family 44 (choline transporter-like protein), member 1
MYSEFKLDKKRSCTDVFCLIVYVVLALFLLIVAIYAWVHPNGNFSKLTTAYDPDGKGCGVDFPNHPYIYFASPHANVTTT